MVLRANCWIAIIDYGMGNLRSVQKGFEKVGHQAVVTSDPAQVAAAAKVVLPGVGAFEDAIAELRRRDLVEPVLAAPTRASRFSASAWGCNCYSTRATRTAGTRGSACCPGEVVRFDLPPSYRAAHGLEPVAHPPAGAAAARHRRGDVRLFRPLLLRRAEKRGVIATETDYGGPFCSMIWRDNVFATQFHPEKSQAEGLRMLKNFAELRA